MADIAKKLIGWCTDWNGAAMVRGEPPRDGLHCDDLLDAAAELSRLRAQVEAGRKLAQACVAPVHLHGKPAFECMICAMWAYAPEHHPDCPASAFLSLATPPSADGKGES